jgi:pyruvate dehydrogenase E2 component (dihydrolipoamide acetyltransferase)
VSEIKLQPLKENVDTVEVNAIKVAPGDTVSKDQPLLEVVADKAAMDVLSPVAGKVREVRVHIGEHIKIGQVYCVIDTGNGAPTPAAPPAKPAAPPPPPLPPELEHTEEPARLAPAPTTSPHRPVETAPVPTGNVVPAGPSTRRLARTLGIDLRQVRGTGRHGRVVEEDVRSFVRQLATGAAAPAPPAVGAPTTPALPRFEDFGPIDLQPLSMVRKATARHLALSWGLIPHVTQHDVADITELEAFRKSQDGKGPKLTILAFVLRAVVAALRELPTFNASLDLANNRLVVKRYYHIGIAVDTDNGLLVPVLRDVDKKGARQLAEELGAIAQRARERKLGPKELEGGTFTISNLGRDGGTAFTPIINWPEAAILGLSRSRLEPVVRDGAIVPRLLLPLSLSYDHRVNDGVAAARFTQRIANLLESPLQMLL